jgi:hypothetical protein
LHPQVRGYSPEGLLACSPDAVRNVLEKSALTLNALRQHQLAKSRAAPELHLLEMGPFPAAHEFQK